MGWTRHPDSILFHRQPTHLHAHTHTYSMCTSKQTHTHTHMMFNLHSHQHLQTPAHSPVTPRCPCKVPRTSVNCQNRVSVRWWWMVRCFHRAKHRKCVCVCLCVCTCILSCWRGFASGVLSDLEVNCQSQATWKSRVKVKDVYACSCIWQLGCAREDRFYVRWHPHCNRVAPHLL